MSAAGYSGVRLSATHGTVDARHNDESHLHFGRRRRESRHCVCRNSCLRERTLEGLTFTPDANFNGTASIEIATRDMETAVRAARVPTRRHLHHSSLDQ